jgi:hypothetical protein
VTSSPAASLHLIAHRAAAAPRNVEDWWGSPFETALAAVAATRHSSAYRADAERTVERLLRWWQRENPRPISADVVALCLTARACAELQHSETTLVAEAAGALGHVAGRDPQIVPLLHVALGAWALDRLVPSRDQAPWPALRTRLERPAHGGVDEPLHALTAALAAPHFDASELVQRLLAEVGASPGLTEACVLLFVLAAAIDRASEQLAASDSGLQVLLRKRAELVERLATEIGDHTFSEPELGDFDPETELDLSAIAYLSTSEALLLDLALASSEPTTPWLTFSESEALFGDQARAERRARERVDRRHRIHIAVLRASLGVAVSVAIGEGLSLAGISYGTALDLAVAVACGGLFLALLGVRTIAAVRLLRLTSAVGKFLALLLPLALLDAANRSTTKPFLAAAPDLYASLLVAAAAVLLWELADLARAPRRGR